MSPDEVLALLERSRDERGERHWQRTRGGEGLRSFGIGLTRLRALAREVGKDHALAQQLWQSDCYDARVVGCLIEDPKKMTGEQVEARVSQVSHWHMTHVWCTCGAPLAKAPFAAELALRWRQSEEATRRRCAFLLLYELASSKKLDDAWFEPFLVQIGRDIRGEENWVKDAMNACLLEVGKRSRALNERALALAEAYWPIEVDYGDNSCEVPDVRRHLRSPRLQEKLA
jgi:3-methyladenine DNA glycosylase AlkD